MGVVTRGMANTLGQKSCFSHRKQPPSRLWGHGHAAATEMIDPMEKIVLKFCPLQRVLCLYSASNVLHI